MRDCCVTSVRGCGAMLRIVPRHLKDCGEDSEPCPSKQRRKCPLWVKGHLNGKLVRRSLETANWQIAAQRVAEIEATGSTAPARAPITVAEATARFLSEAEGRELRDSTLKKFKVLLTREPNPGERHRQVSPSLLMFARSRSLEFLKDFTPDDTSDFRQQWKDVGLSSTIVSIRMAQPLATPSLTNSIAHSWLADVGGMRSYQPFPFQPSYRQMLLPVQPVHALRIHLRPLTIQQRP